MADPSEETAAADPETGCDNEPPKRPQEVAGVELTEARK